MAAEWAFIALGSNLAEPLRQLHQAGRALEGLGVVVVRSSLYETEPVGGPAGQDKYLNAVIILEPFAAFADPFKLLAALLKIEQAQGRERRLRWAARTLDLDLLAYGERIIKTENLILPHPRMMERAFVLAPLCEVDPNWRHPASDQSACEALQGLERMGIKRTLCQW